MGRKNTDNLLSAILTALEAKGVGEDVRGAVQEVVSRATSKVREYSVGVEPIARTDGRFAAAFVEYTDAAGKARRIRHSVADSPAALRAYAKALTSLAARLEERAASLAAEADEGQGAK